MKTTSVLRRAAGLALGLLALASCATDQQVIRQAEETHTELKPAVLSDPQLSNYLQGIGMRIVAAAREADRTKYGPESHFAKGEDNEWMFTKQDEFHLVNSKTLNAFTMGGNHLYIYAQLMEQCRTEDELAAVMAHEYAHVYSRHVHKGMNRQFEILGGAALAGVAGVVVGGHKHGEEYGKIAFLSTAVIGQFLGLGYTRDDEAEADKYGFYFYTHAGWDPNHFGDFFQQLIDKGLDKAPEKESDHPSLSSRVAAAKANVAALPPEAASWRQPPIADPDAFAALKARAALVGTTMPTSEQLAKAQTLLSSVPSCVTPRDQPDQVEAQDRLAQALQEAVAKPKPKP
jgi:predicted Zn-dependent protease